MSVNNRKYSCYLNLKFYYEYFRLGQLLTQLHEKGNPGKIIIFATTKRRTERVNSLLNFNGFSSVVMHGDKTQAERDRALSRFRNDKCQILVATDVAARGLGTSIFESDTI